MHWKLELPESSKTKIFESTKKLLESLIFQNEEVFKIMSREAAILDSTKCDKCNLNLNDKSNFGFKN